MRKLFILLVFFSFVFPCIAQSENDFAITQNSDGTITIRGCRNYPIDLVIPQKINGLKVTIIGLSAFSSPNYSGIPIHDINSVIIPDTVIEIKAYAFNGSGLKDVIIPNSVKKIGVDAFDSNLLSITIGANVNIEGAMGGAFEQSFVNFYKGQGKRGGTYIKRGQIWTLQ